MKVEIKLDRADIQLAIADYVKKVHFLTIVNAGDIQFHLTQNRNDQLDVEAVYP